MWSNCTTAETDIWSLASGIRSNDGTKGKRYITLFGFLRSISDHSITFDACIIEILVFSHLLIGYFVKVNFGDSKMKLIRNELGWSNLVDSTCAKYTSLQGWCHLLSTNALTFFMLLSSSVLYLNFVWCNMTVVSSFHGAVGFRSMEHAS